MSLVQSLVRSRFSVLLTAFIIPSLYFLFFHEHGLDEIQIQRITTDRHNAVAPILSTNTTVEDFGLMGLKVAALADLAAHYQEMPSLDPAHLSSLVTEQFPWWNASSLAYFPWKRKGWSDLSSSDLNIFGSKIGIVVCAGDGNAREAAYLISYLRNVNKSKLPIDVAHVGDADLSPPVRKFLAQLGTNINFIDLTEVFNNDVVNLGGYAAKPFALLASRHPQTILMDADAIFFSSPDTIFKDYPGLRETGALFFHDRSMNMPGQPDRQDWLDAQLEAAGQPASSHLKHDSLFFRRYISEEADAAVVCVDKSRLDVYLSMLFACWMNIQEVREAVTYNMWFGDKDTYWLATELTGVPYSFEPWSSARLRQSNMEGVSLIADSSTRLVRRQPVSSRKRVAEIPETPLTQRYCTTHMVHPTADGEEPLWANGGLWLDKRDRSLGLANWTHWFLGDRIDEALIEADIKSGSLHGMMASIVEDDESQVMDTQPVWYNHDWGQDSRGCEQNEETKWRRLSVNFRDRLQKLIWETRSVEARYRLEVDERKWR